MNLNKAFIVGRVTATPELRRTASGSSVTTFSVATNRTWSDKGGARQEETEFHNVVAWGRQAEIATQFLTKGSLTLVEGRLQTRTWQDKNGANHKSTEIICERLQLGPKPQGGGGDRSGGAAKSAEIPQEEAKEEEIPIINLDDAAPMEEIPF
ncbi:MAG: single-stranded DNA-binding protein [Patescibacteria group bacterium]